MSWLSKLTGVGISSKGIKIDPKKALMTALAVGTGGVGGFAAKAGLGAIASKLGGKAQPTGIAPSNGFNPDGTIAGGSMDDPSRWRSVGNFLSSHKDDILDYGQAAEGVYDKYQQTQDYNRRKPLRDAAMQGLLDTSHRETASIFADPTDPQGRYRTVNVGGRGRV